MLTEKQIKNLNDKFKSLSKAQKRVLIAKDVIAQVKTKKYKAITGSYISNAYFLNKYNLEDSIQNRIDEVYCECCALGACLLSTTKFKNKLTFGDVFGSGGLTAYNDSWGLLREVFTPNQLTLIEDAFEAGAGGSRVGVMRGSKTTNKERVKSTNFGLAYVTNKRRILGIMKNIIKNNGTFKP